MSLLWCGAEIRKIMWCGFEIQKIMWHGAEIWFKGAAGDPVYPELVVNGDFSAGTTGWSVLNGVWDLTGGAAVCTSSSPWRNTLQQWIKIEASTRYTLTLGANNGLVRVEGYTGIWGTALGNMTTDKTTAGVWTFTSQPAATQLHLMLLNNPNPTKIDNISIKKAI
jgi:hypothetical protein